LLTQHLIKLLLSSNVNTPGNLDVGSIIIREVAPGANGITLSSPPALAADYGIQLPTALPPSNAVLQVTSGGVASFALISSLMPSGVVLPFAGSSAPTGYLPCDGASLLVASYPDLFAAIGYTWGGGGANFNVPDLRGRTPIGSGTGPGLTNRTLGTSLGDENLQQHSHTVNNNTDLAGSHTHGVTDPSHYHPMLSFSNGAGGGFALPVDAGAVARNVSHDTDSASTGISIVAGGSHQHPLNFGSNNTGTGSAQNMQPSAVVNFIIKT
jgi:microcystin-dependent protein